MGFGPDDEAALRDLRVAAAPDFPAIAVAFYERILAHEGARKALVGGESQVGHLRSRSSLDGGGHRRPWDEAYCEPAAASGGCTCASRCPSTTCSAR